MGKKNKKTSQSRDEKKELQSPQPSQSSQSIVNEVEEASKVFALRKLLSSTGIEEVRHPDLVEFLFAMKVSEKLIPFLTKETLEELAGEYKKQVGNNNWSLATIEAVAIAYAAKNFVRKGDETKLSNQFSNLSFGKDITRDFVRSFIRPLSKEEIPPIELLSKAIEPDALRVKIPILSHWYHQWPEIYNIASEDFNSVFTLSADGTHCDRLTRDLWAILFSPPFCGTTEDSCIALWDTVIVRPLKMFVPELKCDRNTNKGTSTSMNRPDVVCVLNRIAIFRAEEKAPESNDDPMEELGNKLNWNYKGLPYLLSYHAVGKYVTFDVITPSCEVISISPAYNLDDIGHRFRVFVLLSKLATLLEPLTAMCSNPPAYLECVPTNRSNGKSIQIGNRFVQKRYPSFSKEIVMNIVDVYRKIAGVPFVDRLTHEPNLNLRHQDVLSLSLEPVGNPVYPKDNHELLICLWCVLNALKGLHERKVMHRDIRWPNIVQHRGQMSWFLIDFEDATATIPASKESARHLNQENHAPEMFTADLHNEAVDLWAVGRLIKESRVGIDTKELDTLKHKLLATDPSRRPSVAKALEVIAAIHQSDCKFNGCSLPEK